MSNSLEIGARGSLGGIARTAGVFHTTNEDDILFQTTGRSTGLFANVDKTRRRGFEGRLTGNWQDLNWTLAYSFVDATFETIFKVLSPNHAFADDEGKFWWKTAIRFPAFPRINSSCSRSIGLLIVSASDWT